MNALAEALRNRWSESLTGLIHHSDQGVQYASKDYVDSLKNHNILISMSRKGNPYDNAFAESFIKTLKVEEVYLNEYGTFEDAYEKTSGISLRRFTIRRDCIRHWITDRLISSNRRLL
jgi:putative transposase